MSGLYRDVAVVLRTYKLGEADRIIVLATRDHGKVRSVAKGVRKTSSKFGARLEPMSYIAAQLYAGRNLDTITQVETVESFRPLREDLDRYAAAASVLEVMDATSMEREADGRRFEMLVGALRTLASLECGRSGPHPLVVPAFELKVLAHEGLRPEVDRCVGCGAGDPLVAMELVLGGMLCPSCRQGRAVSPEALRLLRAILGGGLGSVLAEEPSSAAAEVAALATEAMEQFLERRLRTPGLLERQGLR